MQKYIRQLLLICLVTPIYAYAKGIPCPSLNLIQEAAVKIDVATKYGQFYAVYTMDYVLFENPVYWRVGVNTFIATSNEDALQKGKELVKHAAFKNQEEATETNPAVYKCTYGKEHVYALGFTR